jgi:hypothetical protein
MTYADALQIFEPLLGFNLIIVTIVLWVWIASKLFRW